VSQLFDILKALDHKMFALFQDEDLNSDVILSFIDERERILQKIISEFKSVPDFKNSLDWQDAILRTEQIVELIQLETGRLAEQLKKYRHGNKSVQCYQQFL